MRERECDIACISEPYRVPRDPRWVGSAEATPMAAIMWQGPKPPKSITVIGRGKGFVAVLWDGCVVVSGYFSPNRTINQFRAFLSAIGDVLGSSVIDLTWVSHAVLADIRKWEVATEEETLSDHKYVFLDMGHGGGTQRDRRTARGFPQWNLKSLNADLLCACVATRLWPRADENRSAEQLAEWIQTILTEASRVAMSRSRNHHNRPVYWWNAEIAELRKECVRLRRRVTRGRRRHRAAVPPLEAELAQARGALRKAIKEAKNRAWAELLAEVNKDPWGRAYKIVTGKMRPRTRPVNEELSEA
ncbi:PREDICTED: uncharacterized protein LOC105448019 [Wasmannia auropunctata]|uniref:uncharacterized protein LOC105448019 n=1 Tax=Wasmannia auropunctata TaxID=64793 RepID=UPI0005EDE644|nr:PREDICTED: uncharacterized protein LOC105448019 [Wasmannia auropunctata]